MIYFQSGMLALKIIPAVLHVQKLVKQRCFRNVLLNIEY